MSHTNKKPLPPSSTMTTTYTHRRTNHKMDLIFLTVAYFFHLFDDNFENFHINNFQSQTLFADGYWILLVNHWPIY